MIVATVRCGHCKDIRAGAPKLGTVEKLGMVERRPAGLWWLASDPVARRAIHRQNIDRWWTTAVALTMPVAGYEPPATVPAWCRHHGAGQLSTADITNASGTVYLKHRATD